MTSKAALQSLWRTLASVLVLVAATLARPADGPVSRPEERGYQELFREAMRHRDLGRWQEALILFEAARKQNPAEGERVRFYGRKRFPHYVPRFYIGEALFQLGDYPKAFETWRVYDSDGKWRTALPDEQRELITSYRWRYTQQIYPELFKSLAQKMLAARGSLAGLQQARKSLSPERWREVEARVVKAGASCTSRSANTPSTDRFQPLHACLDSAETTLDKAARAGDYSGTQEASQMLESLTLAIADAEALVARSSVAATTTAGGGGTPAMRSGPTLPEYRPSSSGAARGFYEGRYALVIGVWDYKQPWTRLKYVESDINEVSAVLGEVGYEVEVLRNPTKDSFEKTLRRFLQTKGAHPRNQVLVYYAGHGDRVPVIEGGIENAFMLPVDVSAPSDKEPWYYSAVPLLTLVSEIQAVPAEHVLAVLDSCFAGDVFNYTFRQPQGRPASGATGDLRGITTVADPASPNARPSTGIAWVDRGLSRPARWYLTAGRADEKVPDQSQFREAFVSALKGAVQTRAPGILSIDELTRFVEDKLANSKQTPQGRHIGIDSQNEGQILFQLRSPAARATADAYRWDGLRRAQLALGPRADTRW